MRIAPGGFMNVRKAGSVVMLLASALSLLIYSLRRHRIEVRSGADMLGSAPFNVNLVMRQQPGNA